MPSNTEGIYGSVLETRLRLALVGSNTGIWEWDLATDNVYWSPEAHDVMGIGTSEFEGTRDHFSRLVHDEDRQRLRAAVDAALSTDGRFDCRFRIVRGDGEVRWLHTLAQVDSDGDGAPMRVIGTVRDISQQQALLVDLEASERRYRELADAIPQLAWTTRPDGSVDWMNRRWSEYTGLLGAELLQGGWRQAIAPEDLSWMIERFAQAVADGAPCELEYRIRRSDGAWRWHLARLVPLRGADGAVRGWLGTATDLDERRRMEDELRASRQRFAAMFDKNPHPMVITRLADGAYLDVNPAFLQLVNLPRGAVLGRTPVDLGIWSAEERAALASSLSSGSTLQHDDVPFRLPSGATARLVISSERLEFEGVSCILSVLNDVTARRQAEAALQRQEAEARARAEELSAVLEAVPAAVWIASDPQCRNVQGNRAGYGLLRVPAGANLSKTADDPTSAQHFRVLHAGVELPPEALPLQVAAREGIELRNFEEEIRFDGGDSIYLYGNAVPLRDADGKSRGAIAAFLDVTRLKEAEAALRTADRRKDEFLAILSHELRNPMAPILTAVQLMKLRGDTSIARERDIVERQAQYMLRLIDDLLDVSRITQGKIRLQKQPLDLVRVIAKAVETSRPLFEQKQHRLHIETRDGLLVEGDEVRLTQVVCNLLTNAARYTQSGGAVSLEATREGDWVTLRVRDNGIGISKALLPHLFQLFHQAEQGLARTSGGLGLGLALSRSLTELHGGTVEAHSEGEGHGSEFVVRLPSCHRDDEAVARVMSSFRAARPLRILLVDDNLDAAETMSLALSSAGHEVRAANDPAAALSLISDFTPEVALLDIGLPVMDGYALAEELRRRFPDGRVRLMALSGYGQEHDRRRSAAAGFVAHEVKPVDVQRLLQLIDELGARHAMN